VSTGSVYYGVTAELSVLDTDVNMVSNDDPTFESAVTAATDTNAAIRPYSIAVAPDSSFAKSLIVFNILITLGFKLQTVLRILFNKLKIV
jgi:hypothetical protein